MKFFSYISVITAVIVTAITGFFAISDTPSVVAASCMPSQKDMYADKIHNTSTQRENTNKHLFISCGGFLE